MATVESIGSEATAMCLGRFGQHVLLGTANGSVRTFFVRYLRSLSF